MTDIQEYGNASEWKILVCEIPDGDSRQGRRERESAAIERLVQHAFGPGTRKLNDGGGAPYLSLAGVRSETRISVSHSRHFAAFAYGPCAALGIDIEEDRPQLERVIERILSPAEAILCNIRHYGRLEAWTLKEALYKACRRTAPHEPNYSTDLAIYPTRAFGRRYSSYSFPVADGRALLSVVWGD